MEKREQYCVDVVVRLRGVEVGAKKRKLWWLEGGSLRASK